MQEQRPIEWKGKHITINEITVKQIREVMSEVASSSNEDETILSLNDLLEDHIPAQIIIKCTPIKLEELDECKPSELIELAGWVKSVNPTLASMIRKKIEAYEKIITKKTEN